MRLMWLDLETTGLDPRKDWILEVACEFADLTSPFDTNGASMQAVLTYLNNVPLDPFVQEMHTRSGLLAECAESATSVLDAEGFLLECVPELPKEERYVLAGSSVHFDASFLKVHMPRLAKRLSHRLYDVSAVELFCQSLGMSKFPKAESHRAMADVKESIEHCKQCAAWLAQHKRED